MASKSKEQEVELNGADGNELTELPRPKFDRWSNTKAGSQVFRVQVALWCPYLGHSRPLLDWPNECKGSCRWSKGRWGRQRSPAKTAQTTKPHRAGNGKGLLDQRTPGTATRSTIDPNNGITCLFIGYHYSAFVAFDHNSFSNQGITCDSAGYVARRLPHRRSTSSQVQVNTACSSRIETKKEPKPAQLAKGDQILKIVDIIGPQGFGPEEAL